MLYQTISDIIFYKMAFSNIPIPPDAFRKKIMLRVIRQQLNDSQVYLGQEYYISSDNTPIKADQKTIDRINVITDTFPPNSHCINPSFLNELAAKKYPESVKLNSHTEIWYIIQDLTTNVFDILDYLAKLKTMYYIYPESDARYIEVMTDLGFKCIDSKIYRNVCFVLQRANFILDGRDFPVVTHRFPFDETTMEPLPIAAGLLWIYYCFYKYLDSKIDYDLLGRIDYDIVKELYIFPHVSETLTNEIRSNVSEIVSKIGHLSYKSAETAVEIHLDNYLLRQSLVFGKTVAWIREDSIDHELASKSETIDPKFKYLGVNDEDPISLETINDVKDKLSIFLSDHRHNYIDASLKDYFDQMKDSIKLLPYDRDPCPQYETIMKLRKLGILQYHNKRGLFQGKHYIPNDTEWETLMRRLKWRIIRKPYYRPTTILDLTIGPSEMNIDSSDEYDINDAPIVRDRREDRYASDHRNSDVNDSDRRHVNDHVSASQQTAANSYYFDTTTGYFCSYEGEVYPPDLYITSIAINVYANVYHEVFRIIINHVNDSCIVKALRNGLCSLYSHKYLLFGTVTPMYKLPADEGALNDYLIAVFKKYLNNDF